MAHDLAISLDRHLIEPIHGESTKVVELYHAHDVPKVAPARPWNPEVPAALVRPTRSAEIEIRERLSLGAIGAINGQSTPQFIMVRAPAGCGKTTLLCQWSEEVSALCVDHAWITMHSAFENDPALLLRHLAAAWSLGLEEGTTLSAFWQALAPRIQAKGGRAILWADQLDALGTGPAWTLWLQLLEGAPPNLQIVMTSRGELPTPLIRLRLYGHVVELGASDLRFTHLEVSDYLAKRIGAAPTLSQVRKILHITNGWALAVGILGRSISSPAASLSHSHGIDEAIGELSGERADVWQYFLHEVWERQPERMQLFLGEIACLERVSAPLCDSVRRSNDSAGWLNQCERLQLFCEPLDPNHDWFRLQPLFAQFLARMQQQKVGREQWQQSCLRAIEWLSAHREYLDAFRLSLRIGDTGRASAALEAIYDTSYATTGEAFVELARCLPQASLASRPRIQLAIVMRDIVQRRFEDARRSLETIRLQIDLQAREGGETGDVQELRNLLLHREVLLSFFLEDLGSVKRGCEELLTTYPGAAPWVKRSLFTSLLATYVDIGNLRRVDALAGAASRLEDIGEASISQVYYHATLGYCYLAMGRSEEAIRELQGILQNESVMQKVGAPVRATAGLHLAHAIFETGSVEDAERLLEEHLPHSYAHCPYHVQIAGWITQIRLTRARKGIEAAILAADEAIVHARRDRLSRLEATVQAELMTLALQAGRPELVRSVGAELELPETSTSLLPSGTSHGVLEERAFGWIQSARLQNAVAAAISLSRHWIRYHANAGAVLAELRWTTELAHLQAMLGDTSAVQRTVRRALELAVEGNFVRRIEDDPTCMNLLMGRPEIVNGVSPRVAAFYRKLTSRHQPATANLIGMAMTVENTQNPVTGALTNSEIDILRMIASGYGNVEIAKALGRTEASVKWSLQQVFDKLGTRKRRQALERARSLGLVS